MTIAKLQLIRRLLLQLVAMVDEELRMRGAVVGARDYQQP
jgi:hypothetical protein